MKHLNLITIKRLLEDGPAPGYLLYALVQHHDHPAGGNAFIEYVLGMGWVEAVQ